MERLFSVRGKLTLLISFVVCLLALLDVGLVPSRFADAERESLAQRARAEAALLADAVAAALEFEQTDSAREALGAAIADPLVRWAAIYQRDGNKMLAVGDHAPLTRIRREGLVASDRSWEVVAAAPIAREGRRLGYVTVALSTTSAEKRLMDMRWTMLVQAAMVAVIGILLAIWISSRIARPLERVTHAAGDIASGDVSQDLAVEPTRDEVGALSFAFRTMSTRLRELVQRIGGSAESLATAAAGMFSEVREQEALATQQTASLEEIRRTLETLSTAAEQVEVDATTVRNMAQSNLTSSQQIAERTRMVSAHSDRIGEILSLIQDIADRSDLLALNAALEGTKAGEVGKGFSLVAAEMRRLSEHVKDSVRDIRKLVADMREASHASVLATEEGIKLSRETSAAATKISDAVGRQREGTSQAKSSADEIVRVVNESLRGRAETTRSAEALLQLSQDLKEAVSVFRVTTAHGSSNERRSG